MALTPSPSPSPSPLSSRHLNCSTPPTVKRQSGLKYVESQKYSIYEDTENLYDLKVDHDNGSVASLEIEISTSPFNPPDSSPSQNITKSPTGSPQKQPSPSKKMLESPAELSESALRENGGLTKVVQMLENDANKSVEQDIGNDTASTIEGPQGYPGMDDTDFTTFSAVPNADVTLFNQIGQSPNKSSHNSPSKTVKPTRYHNELSTPPQLGGFMPQSAKRDSFNECSPSPTPRRQKTSHDDDTNLILDFTEQFNAFTQPSSRPPNHSNRSSPRKSQTQPNLASYILGCRTPSPSKKQTAYPEGRHHLNLLDFDIPPAPTPRSVPSITARELESLKSSFLSQVSSLRATLSGKEAEVNSLKDAVADAERRVGEALEKIREERGTKESLQGEKLEWERRDKEMQSVLRSVKEINIQVDRERDQLQQRLDESERRREEVEAKAIEAQSKIAGLESSAPAIRNGDGTPGVGNTSGNVEAAVEKVAKELHGLYRQKHETKVAALKESYRARWERRVRELETKVDDLGRENEELRLGRDATLSGVLPQNLPTSSEDGENQMKQRAAEAQRIQEVETHLVESRASLFNLKQENANLLTQLKKERLEMAELVAATEEMMQLSLEASSTSIEPSQPASTIENFRSSISRPGLGLKPPGESRIGKVPTGVKAFGLGGTRSGIMGNIERMGRGREGG